MDRRKVIIIIFFSFFIFHPTISLASSCGDEPCPTPVPDWAVECGGINFPNEVTPGQKVQFTVQNFNVGARDWKALVATKTSEGQGIKLKVEAFNGAVSFNYPFHINGSYLVWPRGKKSAPDESGEREVMTGEVLWGAYADTCYGNCYRRKSGFRVNFCPIPEISCANLGCNESTCPLEINVPTNIQSGTYEIKTYVFADGEQQNFSAIGQCTKKVTVTSPNTPTNPPAVVPTVPPQEEPTPTPTAAAALFKRPTSKPASTQKNPLPVNFHIVLMNPYFPYRAFKDGYISFDSVTRSLTGYQTEFTIPLPQTPSRYNLTVHTSDNKVFNKTGTFSFEKPNTISLTLANPIFVALSQIATFSFNALGFFSNILQIFNVPFKNL